MAEFTLESGTRVRLMAGAAKQILMAAFATTESGSSTSLSATKSLEKAVVWLKMQCMSIIKAQ
jgi:hypothetical protein